MSSWVSMVAHALVAKSVFSPADNVQVDVSLGGGPVICFRIGFVT